MLEGDYRAIFLSGRETAGGTMETTITVLVEDEAGDDGLRAEHGLCFHIERGGRRMLFDTGQGGVLADNARRMEISLDDTDIVVLSHGHYDHTGGLGVVLNAAGEIPVYAHPAAFEPKYSRSDSGNIREIGMPFGAKDIGRRADIVYVEGPIEIADGCRATGPVPRETDFEDTGGPFFVDAECRNADDLVDDQAVFFAGARGTVVILGCAHAGVVNTLRYVRALTGGRKIDTVIGGMHLLRAGEERLGRTIDTFRRLAVRRLAPAHCTGRAAQMRIREAFPECWFSCPAGTVVRIP